MEEIFYSFFRGWGWGRGGLANELLSGYVALRKAITQSFNLDVGEFSKGKGKKKSGAPQILPVSPRKISKEGDIEISPHPTKKERHDINR